MSNIWRNIKQTICSVSKYQNYLRYIERKSYAVMNLDDDGDQVPEGMRTKVTVLNKEDDGVLLIDAYSSIGFRLNTGVRLMGPCVVFPRSVLHWNVRNVQSINEDSLSLFTMLAPKLEILVLGIGESENVSNLSGDVVSYLRSHKLNVEILPTQQALATFNFLNSEKRYIAGAFLPPNYVESELSEESKHQIPLHEGRPFEIPDDFFSYNPETDSKEAIKDRKEFPKALKEQRKLIVDRIYGKSDREKKEREEKSGEPRSDQD